MFCTDGLHAGRPYKTRIRAAPRHPELRDCLSESLSSVEKHSASGQSPNRDLLSTLNQSLQLQGKLVILLDSEAEANDLAALPARLYRHC